MPYVRAAVSAVIVAASGADVCQARTAFRFQEYAIPRTLRSIERSEAFAEAAELRARAAPHFTLQVER